MKKRTLLIVIAILCALLLTACGCKHEWADATCTAPKTCNLCGEQEGEALGHAESEKELSNFIPEEAAFEYVINCDTCGEQLRVETETPEMLYEDHMFLMSIEDFELRVNYFLDDYFDGIDASLCINDDDTVSCDFAWSDGSMISYVFFYDGNYCLESDETLERSMYDCVYLVMDAEQSEASSLCMLAVMSALNANGEEGNIMDAFTNAGDDYAFTYAGLNYELGQLEDEGLIYLDITIDR